MGQSGQTMADATIVAAMGEMAAALLGLRNADGGWAYRSGDGSCTEATGLAALALSVQSGQTDLTGAGGWLAARQRGDGFLTGGLVHQEASWATAPAGMALARLGHADAASRAAEALLSAPVKTFGGVLRAGLYGYDTTIGGWAWTAGDFSFVEPTALAMIFLKQQGHGQAERVRAGARLLRDRAVNGGGWNYGEPEVLGGRLYPTVAATALALMALADERDDVTEAGLGWLLSQRGQIGSLFSLGWAGTALNVLGDSTWREDVAGVWIGSGPERREAMETALAMLALADSGAHPFRVG